MASLSGLKIWCCHELWCRSQTKLGSDVAVAVVYAVICSSDSTPSWELSYALGAVLKNKKQQQKKKAHLKPSCQVFLKLACRPCFPNFPPGIIILLVICLCLVILSYFPSWPDFLQRSSSSLQSWPWAPWSGLSVSYLESAPTPPPPTPNLLSWDCLSSKWLGTLLPD